MDIERSRVSRRAFLGRLGAGTATVGVLLAGCDVAGPRPQQATPAAATAAPSAAVAAASPAASAVASSVIRLSSVVIPQESGLYAQLLPEFERRTGYRVEVTTAQDVYGPARLGKFDIVLSHYQHEGVSPFVQETFGEWPRTVFSSPIAVVGPPSDPAGIRGVTDVVEAFRRIGRTSKFVVNDQDGLRYLADVIRRSGEIPLADWYVDKGTRGPDAMRAAAQSGAYTMWGLVPFLRLKQQQAQMPLEALMTQDQLLRSLMVTIVVDPRKVSGVNATGARSLQHYLLEPATQAKIRTFRMAGVAEQVWWPAAHDNENGAFSRP